MSLYVNVYEVKLNSLDKLKKFFVQAIICYETEQLDINTM
jgi:hypothetical protein